MLSFFKCKKERKPVTIKPIKSSYSDSNERIELSAPTEDSIPMNSSRKPRSSFAMTEPAKSSFKKSNAEKNGRKHSVTWDDEGDYDHSIDLSAHGSSKTVNRRISSGVTNEIAEGDEQMYLTNGVGLDGPNANSFKDSSMTKGSKSSVRSLNNNSGKDTTNINGDVVTYGSDKINKIPKGKVEPMRINSQLDKVKELYNENSANEGNKKGSMSNYLSAKFSSKRLDQGVKNCTLIASDESYGRKKYFSRDKREPKSIFKKMESYEEYTEKTKKSEKVYPKKSGFFSNCLISNCFPLYSQAHSSKYDNDNDCDLNLSHNYMNAKNKILHREHSAGTSFFNNRLSSFGNDKGYVNGRGPGCASMSTNPAFNPTVVRKRGEFNIFDRTVSNGDKFCIRGGMMNGSDESSIMYRLSKGISGLQTSTYVLPERPFLKRNSLDYTRDSKLYYIKAKAAHERREKSKKMDGMDGGGYYDENGEYVDIVPPPYLTRDSSSEEVVHNPSFWERCCPR